MNIVWTKVTVAFLLGLLRLISGLLPLKLYTYLKVWQDGPIGLNPKNRRQELVECCVALVQSFGGGVLFATCFLHMMPEVYYSIRELEQHAAILARYPFSQLIISMGFFMVYFVEEISQYMISQMPENVRNPEVHEKQEEVSKVNSAKNKICPVLDEKQTAMVIEELDEKHQKDSPANMKSIETESLEDSVDSGLDKSADDLSNIPVNLPPSEKDLIIQLEKSPKRILRCILITLALSFHAIFEGIAIGLQHSVTNIWYIFIAISVHSFTLLFCVGVELLFSQKSKTVIFLFILSLSVTSPIGIFIGLAVTSHTKEENLATAIASALLEGLSAGTMLYITFFEVLSREKEKREFKLRRGVCILCGFCVMALLQTAE